MKVRSSKPPLTPGDPVIASPKRNHEARGHIERAIVPAVRSSFERVHHVRPRATPVSPLGLAFEKLPVPTVSAGVRLLEENTEAWLALWHGLEHTTGPIDASYFILQRDVFGLAFLGGLLKRARGGDPVRLMVDAQGDSFGRKGFTLSFRGQDYLQELVATKNVQIRVYNPIHKKAQRPFSAKGARFGSIASNHDKIFRSADLVITGGRNISKDYFTAPADRSDVYRDTDLLVTGKHASREAKRAFDLEFENSAAQFKVYSDVFGNFRRRDAEMLGAHAMMKAWLGSDPRLPSAFSDADLNRLRNDPAFREGIADRLYRIALEDLKTLGLTHEPGFFEKRSLRRLAEELSGHSQLFRAQAGFSLERDIIPNQAVKFLDRTSAASNQTNEIGRAIAALADRAQKKIVIQNPYVVLTKAALETLERAGKRGVQIEIHTNSPSSTDSVLTQAFFLEDWPRLLARVPNLRIFVHTGEQKLHAKTAIADDEIALVSSYNLDLLSEQVNGEIAVVAHSTSLADELAKSYADNRKNRQHNLVEYRIERGPDGQPVIRDGEPVVAFGPEDHVGKWKMLQLDALRFLVRQARKLSWLEAIQKPSLPARV